MSRIRCHRHPAANMRCHCQVATQTWLYQNSDKEHKSLSGCLDPAGEGGGGLVVVVVIVVVVQVVVQVVMRTGLAGRVA